VSFSVPKKYGSILRGSGPPAPGAGIVGDLYIDAVAWGLYEKRADSITDPWGHYLFTVPVAYRTGLKYFGPSAPSDSVGLLGDYCLLWGGYANYGLQPSVFGPKQATSWPENGNGGTLPILAPGTITPIGLLAEGAALPESNSTQRILTGALDEVIAPIPVKAAIGDLVQQIGVAAGPAPMAGVAVNPLYTAEDSHSV
jgi:hypothetical protein